MKPFQRATDLIKDAVEDGRLAGAAIAIGDRDTLYAKEIYGYTSFTEEKTPVNTETLFDMASVTKIMSTTMVALRFIADGKIDPADTLPVYFGDQVPPDKAHIMLYDLLTHTSGFDAHVMLEDYLKPGEDPVPFLLSLPLGYETGTQVVYSCLGFILLGKVLERCSGQPLDRLAQEIVFGPLHMTHTGYHRIDQPIDSRNTVYTERDKKTGKWLCGQVHDENARLLNGVSGNAGVFSTIDDSIIFAQMLANHGTLHGVEIIPRTVFDVAIHNYTPGKDENRGLGFHLANGHCSYSGMFFDQKGFGHTGFTGPHIIVSPDSGLFVVVLNNRVHPDRDRDSGNLRLRRMVDTQAAIAYDAMMRQKMQG